MGTPKQILILRHAEKPGDPAADDVDGEDPHLAPRGAARAAALALLWSERFDPPDRIYSTAPSTASNRPFETIKPLADRLGLSVSCAFRDKHYADLAQAIFGDEGCTGKRVCIAWHHGKIPELAAALGATKAPDKWHAQVFDRVWVLDFDAAGAVTFSQRRQQLLFGDSLD